MKQDVKVNEVKTKCMGVDQAEMYTGISRWNWRRMAYDSKIASYKIGKRLLIPVSEIERILAEGYRPALKDLK